MWRQFILLSIYLVILFLISRIFEFLSFYNGAFFTSRMLNPASLSVKELKCLLDHRGFSYNGIMEKNDLIEIIESSGESTREEIVSASIPPKGQSVNFTCGSHFYEEVEDTKDSVWVVQVITDTKPFLTQTKWNELIQKLSSFDIRTGVFHCNLDWRLCDRKEWHSDRLVLALPQSNKIKDNVVLHSFNSSNNLNLIQRWISLNLASRVRKIFTIKDYEENWVYSEERRPISKIGMIMFSSIAVSPLFFSVLSVKFTGRMRFAIVHTKSKEAKQMVKRLGIKSLPHFKVVTPEKNYTFGKKRGEYPNYRSIFLFLKTFHPEVNDLFSMSLSILNFACIFGFFTTHGHIFKRFIYVFWCFGKWNLFTIFFWLPVLGLFQLPQSEIILTNLLKFLRLISFTSFASSIRSTILFYSNLNNLQYALLLTSFLCFLVIVEYFKRFYHFSSDISNVLPFAHWQHNWNDYISYFLVNSSFGSRAVLTSNSSEHDLELGMELLIERLAVPNFWLQPMVSPDYIGDLPTWNYTGHSVDSDIASDTEFSSSEEDQNTQINNHISQSSFLFTCPRCRFLQQNIHMLASNRDSFVRNTQLNLSAAEDARAKFLMDGNYKCACNRNGGACDHENVPIANHPSETSLSSCRNRFTNHAPRFGMINASECVICLDNFHYGVSLCGLPCGHYFHRNCIMMWLSHDNHCCPVCRWPTYKAKLCHVHKHYDTNYVHLN